MFHLCLSMCLHFQFSPWQNRHPQTRPPFCQNNSKSWTQYTNEMFKSLRKQPGYAISEELQFLKKKKKDNHNILTSPGRLFERSKSRKEPQQNQQPDQLKQTLDISLLRKSFNISSKILEEVGRTTGKGARKSAFNLPSSSLTTTEFAYTRQNSKKSNRKPQLGS